MRELEAEWRRYRDGMIARLPGRVGRPFVWLLAEERKIARLLVGVLMILGGLFSFLPLLGLWMAPVGIILLAEDIAFFRRLGLWLFRRIDRRYPRFFDRRPS